MNNLTQKHKEDLRASTLTDESIARYDFLSITAQKASSVLGFQVFSDGWMIRYPDSIYLKYKPDQPTIIKGKKPVKYLSPKNMTQDLFITHLLKKKRDDLMVPIYFTEGEKKAIAIEQLNYAAISIPGVYGWSSREHVVESLTQLNLRRRECFIVFDADKYSNDNVCDAEKRFAEVLRSFGAIVKIVNLPPGIQDEGKNIKGVDDFIAYYTKIRYVDELRNILSDAESYDTYIARQKEARASASKYTDTWNAERLVELCGENFRWCQEMKSWFVWDGKIWKKDSGGLLVEWYAKKTTKAMMQSHDKNLLKHAKASQAKNKLEAMVELAKSEPGISIETDAFNKDGFLLNCENGIVDLRTGNLTLHDRSKFITKVIKTKYNPQAQCPRWEWFLNDIFDKNQDLINFLKKAIGYSLTDSVREQCFFILYGTGRNGKNTFLDPICHILGDYSCKTPVSTLMVKHNKGSEANEDIADLWGKRLVMASESDRAKILSESVIKELTGDKKVKARFLYGHLFEFNPTFKIFLLTNNKPKIRGTDEGIWSRPRLVPFTKFIPPEKRIPDLVDQLITEEPEGILRWAVDACLLWQKEGLGTAPEIDRATSEYKEEEDLIGNFIKENMILGEHLSENATRVYERFKVWAKNSGVHYILDIKDFGHAVEAKGYSRGSRTFGREKGRIFWNGFSLSESETASTERGASTGTPTSFPMLDEEQ